MSESRSILQVSVENIKAIERLQFRAGKINVLSGRNGSGKSSVLDAIDSVFSGGHDAGLIRIGADKGEVELLISDGVTIRKTITPKTSTLVVTTADGGIVKAPQSYVNELAASFSYDPLALIDAKPAERMKWLLEHLPIEFTGAELNQALGIVKYQVHEQVALERLNQIAEGIRASRTNANRLARDREGMLRRQQEAIGADDETDWTVKLRELTEEQTGLEKDIAAGAAQVEAQAERLRSECRERANKEIQIIKDRLIAELKDIEVQSAEVLREGQAEAQARVKELESLIVSASEKQAQQQRNVGARQNLEQIRKEMSAANVESFDLSQQLDRIEALKKTKLGEIPIEGLDIREGEIYVNDIHWDHVNTSQQDIVAMQLGAYGLRKLPLMILERSEHMDNDRWANIIESLKDAGIQVFAERVSTQNELTITADEAEFTLSAPNQATKKPRQRKQEQYPD